MGFLIILGILLLLLSPGLYYSWKTRHHDMFVIHEQNGKFTLWYNYRGEWMIDSVHNSKEKAEKQIDKYILRKSERALRTGTR